MASAAVQVEVVATAGPRARSARKPVRATVFVALFIVYVVAARLGLKLAFVNPSATAIWPPTGIALVAFLVFGFEIWPAILGGAFVANLLTAGTVATSFGIAVGNTLEGVLGAYLVNRFAGGLRATRSSGDLLRLAVFAGLLSTAVSATIGVTTLTLGGFARWEQFGSIWLTWWLGDASGDLLLAPALLAWISSPTVKWELAAAAEGAAMFASLALVAMFVFGGLSFSAPTNLPLEYLCAPILVWAAFRFGMRETASALVALAAIAVSGTLHGFGPFIRATPNESFLLLQLFLCVMALMTLSLATVITERRADAEQLRVLTTVDALTGLVNYRKLMVVIEREIVRSLRTERPFAILLLDVDGLKKINDRYGHIAGSDALRRMAAAMRGGCREIDTAARYGGDEFALVLPESGEDAARTVAARITEWLATDGGTPSVNASVGIAEFPRDGNSTLELIGAADMLLYKDKARTR